METIDIKHLIKEAKHNEDAMIILGCCYQNGYGVKQDCFKAMKYFLNASYKGNVLAKEQVAKLYMDFYEYFGSAEKEMKELIHKHNNPNGYCLLTELYLKYGKQNEAKESLDKAIELNAPNKNYLLGKLHTSGSLVEKDPQKAFEYFQKSAQEENDIGKCELALCYLNGIGTQKDVTKALEYLTPLANKVASTMRSRLYLAMGILQNKIEDRYQEAINLLNSVSYKINEKNTESLDWTYCNAICLLYGLGVSVTQNKGLSC